jgi:hypothetical protein
METSVASILLQDELEAWIATIKAGEKFRCFGQPKTGGECRNPISISRKTRLAVIFQQVVERLQDDDLGVEDLLEEASSLVMCVRYHQDQAPKMLLKWSKRIPSEILEVVPERPSTPVSPSTTRTIDPLAWPMIH